MGALAADARGNLFFSAGRPDAGLVMRIDRESRVSRLVARVPGAGPAGERSSSLAPDGEGGVLVALGDRVIDVDPGNAISVVAGPPPNAGGGPRRSAGDGGPAREATFGDALSLAVDEGGNLFIADRPEPSADSFRVRLVNRTTSELRLYQGTPAELVVAPGAIDTIAGGAGGNAPGLARWARLRGDAPALAVSRGRLYLAASPRVGEASGGIGLAVVNLGGAPIRTNGVDVAPGAQQPLAGPAASEASHLSALAAGSGGSLYLADEAGHRVLRIDDAGEVETVAGGGRPGFNGNDRSARGALLNHPRGLAVAADNRVYVADAGNGQLRFVDAEGSIRIALGAGSGLSPSCDARDDVPGRGAPAAVVATADRGILFVSQSNRQVKRLIEGGRVSTVLDAGAAVHLNGAAGLALSPLGDLYTFDGERGIVQVANLAARPHTVQGTMVAPGAVAILAGNGRGPNLAPVDRQRHFYPPSPLALDRQQSLFIADLGNHRVLQLDHRGAISILAGIGADPPTGGCCTNPIAVAVDERDDLYVTDAVQHRVWFINRGARPVVAQGQLAAPGQPVVVAGSGGFEVSGDGGPATQASLREPIGLALDRRGNLYVADPGESTIRRVDARGVITTALGTGAPGFNGDGLLGRLTQLSYAAAVAVDPCGNLLVADQGNDRIRRLDLVPCPLGGASQLSAEPRPPAMSTPMAVLLVATLVLAGALGGGLWWVRRGRR